MEWFFIWLNKVFTWINQKKAHLQLKERKIARRKQVFRVFWNSLHSECLCSLSTLTIKAICLFRGQCRSTYILTQMIYCIKLMVGHSKETLSPSPSIFMIISMTNCCSKTMRLCKLIPKLYLCTTGMHIPVSLNTPTKYNDLFYP